MKEKMKGKKIRRLRFEYFHQIKIDFIVILTGETFSFPIIQ